ncbi:MAG: glucosidase, partial [Pseudonocardiales bacterium]|nr:glucosidase [Pseudonocardiales bacterium]
ATKFLEHFLGIARAVNDFGSTGVDLWDEEDGFCYDVVRRPDGTINRLRVRSMVGLLPILAVAAAEPWVAEELPDFTSRLRWLSKRRPELMGGLVTTTDRDGTHALLSLLGPDRLPRVLARMLDENEFLSPFGIRSLSAVYRTPFTMTVAGEMHSIDYEPGESTINLFGGNSNWRGPIWLPVNVLLTAALRTYATHRPEGAIEMPTGSGQVMPLHEIADDIEQRLISLFRRGPSGSRPSDGARIEASADPLWLDQLTFSEYFHADTGEGLGATHQTGWTALVAHLICQRNQ